MYVIIAGAGNIGREVIERLTMMKQDVVVIEQSKEVCDEIYAKYGIETINGNATEISVLRAAGINKADVIISTIRRDDVNLAVTALAKSFNVPEIIVLMRNPNYSEAYRTSGATRILNVANTIIKDIMYQIEKPSIKRVAYLGDGAAEVFIVEIPEDSKITGKTISEVASNKNLPEESIIAGIYNKEENEYEIPRGNTKIKRGSNLFVITKPKLVKKTAQFLMK